MKNNIIYIHVQCCLDDTKVSVVDILIDMTTFTYLLCIHVYIDIVVNQIVKGFT